MALNKWKQTKIGDLCTVGRGSSPRPIIDPRYFEGGTIPWIKIADATKSGKYLMKTKEYVNSYGASFSRLLPPKSIIVAASGVTLGYVQILGISGCVHDGWLCLEKLNGVDVDYLYYALQELNGYFFNVAYGAAIQNINTTILRETQINLPPLDTQRKIGAILSAYDDLIENNRRRIAILEVMARMIYREWFVNFRFPGHETTTYVDSPLGLVPEGWKYVPVRQIVSNHIGGGWGKDEFEEKYTEPAFVVRGTDFPKVRAGDVATCPLRYHQVSNLRSRKLKPKDIVIEVSGGSNDQPVGRALFITDQTIQSIKGDVMCASFCRSIQVDCSIIPPEILYYHLEEIYADRRIEQYQVQSTGIKNFKFETFLDKEFVVVPIQDIQNQFLEVVTPMIDSSQNLGRKNSVLRTTRDLLLPKLISGELDVSEVDIGNVENG